MSDLNPQIESQLDSLAELCCAALQGGDPIASEKTDKLLRGLLMSGFSRKSSAPLLKEIETRVKDRCSEPAMHRGGALSSISDQLQKRYENVARWYANQPHDDSGTKGANISSSTDA